jgi:hypothetical protein
VELVSRGISGYESPFDLVKNFFSLQENGSAVRCALDPRDIDHMAAFIVSIVRRNTRWAGWADDVFDNHPRQVEILKTLFKPVKEGPKKSSQRSEPASVSEPVELKAPVPLKTIPEEKRVSTPSSVPKVGVLKGAKKGSKSAPSTPKTPIVPPGPKEAEPVDSESKPKKRRNRSRKKKVESSVAVIPDTASATSASQSIAPPQVGPKESPVPHLRATSYLEEVSRWLEEDHVYAEDFLEIEEQLKKQVAALGKIKGRVKEWSRKRETMPTYAACRAAFLEEETKEAEEKGEKEGPDRVNLEDFRAPPSLDP